MRATVSTTSISHAPPPQSARREPHSFRGQFGKPISPERGQYCRPIHRPDARTIINQLPAWLHYYNEVHPHKALGYRSPREYIQQTREAPSGI
ncbi:hypothetical protein EJC47_20520 [Sphingomonas sp. TF3]|nr:hypothetical protein EJC47_20520 [Sphingomonas sp. TF3]